MTGAWARFLTAPLLLSAAAGLLGLLLDNPARHGPPAIAPPRAGSHLRAEPLRPQPVRPQDVVLAMKGGDALIFHPLIVTGYSSSPIETDSTPYVTASMTRVRPGCLALSRDLLRTFTPGAPFDFGDWVVLPGIGIFSVEDTMHARWRNRADIWFPNRRQALRWGRRKALIARLPQPLDEALGLFALGPAGS